MRCVFRHRLGTGGVEIAAEEQGAIEAVELDERFAAAGGGLDFIDLRLREITLVQDAHLRSSFLWFKAQSRR